MLRLSSTIRLSKNLRLSIDVLEKDEVNIGDGGDCKNKRVKRSLFKKSNKVISYLTLDARVAFTQLRQMFAQSSNFSTQ